VANQIAAGEVVQRPASIVKELLENSIDAGATEVKLVVRDAGKSLVQVIDDGKGMSETDARLSFERHATSKIRKADDLFALSTMGFRGEALASIAAVAQVELKTRQAADDLGTEIRIEGSQVLHQEYCQTAAGTVISVKNLFYNIPARRNFLKGDNVELRHIIDEFERVALANPSVGLHFLNKQTPVFNLAAGNLRQRISGIFGRKYNERLVPVDESTDVVKLTGFVLKPAFARKTRGEQFFFVNNRFIKNHYLHHAISDAFNELIPTDQHPGYFLFMDIDPARIDVNIHPTKTEIKFDDEKAIYAIIRVSVKHALGQFNVAPSIDFEREASISTAPIKPGQTVKAPQIIVNPNFNPFADEDARVEKSNPQHYKSRPDFGNTPKNQPWESLFVPQDGGDAQMHIEADFGEENTAQGKQTAFQLFNTYIAQRTKSDLVLIHQQRAHERILYEKFSRSLANHSGASQQLLFPQHLSIKAGELALLNDYIDDLRQVGFDIEPLGQTTLVIQGIPLALAETESMQALEEIMEGLKHNKEAFELNKNHQLAFLLARHGAIKTGKVLSTEEMLHLADQLFACEMPNHAPNGKPVIVQLNKNDIEKQFH